MAVRNKNGHGVTSVLPDNADGVQVAPAKIVFQQAPANQSGGIGNKGVANVNPTGHGKKY